MASRCFGKLVAEVMREAKFEAVTSVPNTYHHPQRDTDTVVHGDDFVAVAEDGHLDHFEQVLKNSIENKRVGRIGPRIIVRQHLTVRKQMGLLKRAVRRSERRRHLQYCCNQAWMKSGGRILWHVTAIFETFKTSCLMGKHLTNGGLANHFEGPIIPFCSMVEYHSISAKDVSRLHQFGKKSYQVYSLAMYCTRVGIWKGDIWVADIEELEKMDASEILAWRINAKEVLTPQKGEV